MAYTWDDPKAPGRGTTQYFEMFGTRAIYHDGWNASAPPIHPPWQLGLEQLPTDVMNGFKWHLDDIDKDWTQANDLAGTMPDKLRDMQQRFIMEAEKYQVFPLDDSTLGRFVSQDKPNYAFGRTLFTYTGEIANVPYPGIGGAPSLLDRSYTVTADSGHSRKRRKRRRGMGPPSRSAPPRDGRPAVAAAVRWRNL